MFRRLVIATGILALAAASVSAQSTSRAAQTPQKPAAQSKSPAQPKPPEQPKPAAEPKPAPAPRREGQAVNVKVELVITDQRGTAAPVKKNVSVIVGDEREGSIRSTSRIPAGGGVQLNVDAYPSILADGKIRVNLRIFYDLPVGDGRSGNPNDVPPTQIQESVNLILENGKPIVVTQSADPMIDRQVTVEVKATVLK